MWGVMSGVSRDAYLAGTGGTHWGSEVVGAAFDKAGEALAELSNSISRVFSSIYKNHLEPLITSYQQGKQSITDGRSFGRSPFGSIVKEPTVRQSTSGTTVSRPKPQVSYKLSSPEEYKSKLTDLHRQYGYQQSGYQQDYERYNVGHDHGRNEDQYDYILNPYREEMAKLSTQIEGFTNQFKTEHPTDFNAFQKELKVSKAKEEESRSESTDYSFENDDSSDIEGSGFAQQESIFSSTFDNDSKITAGTQYNVEESDPEWW